MRSILLGIAYRYSWIWLWDQEKRREFKRNLRASGKLKPRKRFYTVPSHFNGRVIHQGQTANNMVLFELQKNKPCYITRFGSIEFKTIRQFYKQIKKPRAKFSKGYKDDIRYAAGFFTPTDEQLTQFCCDSLQALKNVDIFQAWCYTMSKKYSEKDILEVYNKDAKLVSHEAIAFPFRYKEPWTQYLEGKKVLVCHPFVESIKSQYQKREKLFDNPKVLPKFELITMKVVQGLGDAKETKEFENWYDAFHSMCKKIDTIDFDIALVSGGAYGMLLSNHIKEQGKQVVHLAGALQLLFGIYGHRYEGSDFINEHWIRPNQNETPQNMEKYTSIESTPAYW